MSVQDLKPTDGATPGVYYGYTVVVAASLSMVLVFSVHYAFGVFFRPLFTEFGWTRAETAGAFSLVWIAQGLLAIVMGGLNDRLGPRIVLTVCGVLIGSGYLLMSQIHQLWQLYLFYGVLVGAGLGGTFVPLTSTTARWFVAKRGLMTGIVTAGVGIGALVGPLIANRLITIYDWRVSYLILGSVALVGVVVSAQFLRRDPAQMGLKPYGFDERAGRSPKDGVEGLVMRQAIATRQFWFAAGAFLCYGFSLSAILLHIAPHATDLGISAGRAAAIIALIGGSSVVAKVLFGIVADRIGNKNVYVGCYILMIASLVWLVTIRELWALNAFAVLFGFAYGGLASAHSPLVAWLFGMKQHGLIFGLCFNGWTIGCAVGPIVAGYIFDVTHSYQLAFLICAGLSVVGLLLTVLLTPVGATARQFAIDGRRAVGVAGPAD